MLHYASGNTHCSLLDVLFLDLYLYVPRLHYSYSYLYFNTVFPAIEKQLTTARVYACTWCSALLWKVPLAQQHQYLSDATTASSFYSPFKKIAVDFSTMDSCQHFITLAAGASWFLLGSLECLYSLTPALSTAHILFLSYFKLCTLHSKGQKRGCTLDKRQNDNTFSERVPVHLKLVEIA